LCIGTCHNILAWDQNWSANVASIFKASHLDEVFDDMFVLDLYKSIGDFCPCAKPFEGPNNFVCCAGDYMAGTK
jgi:hypothetical protein